MGNPLISKAIYLGPDFRSARWPLVQEKQDPEPGFAARQPQDSAGFRDFGLLASLALRDNLGAHGFVYDPSRGPTH